MKRIASTASEPQPRTGPASEAVLGRMNSQAHSASAAGIIGPLGFLAIAFGLAALRPDVMARSGWAGWPSSLATGGSSGIPMMVDFLFLATCYCIFAFRAVRPVIAGSAPWIAFLLVAMGDLLLAFPTDVGGGPGSWHGIIHTAGVLTVTAATLAAAIILAVVTRSDPGWRAWRLVGMPLIAFGVAIGLTDMGQSGSGKVAYVLLITLPVPIAAIRVRRGADAVPRPEGGP